jgi:hypothetical protein
LVIGTGNHFEVLIPLSDINPEGQTYRIIRSSERNREYVLFVNGIEPQISRINRMPQGFDRYEVFKLHEAEANLKALALLRHAFPDSTIDATALLLWNDEHLPDATVRLKITPDGLLIPSAKSRPRLQPEARP